MKKPHQISNRVVTAVVMMLATFAYGLMTVLAQTSGLPAPPLANAGGAETFFALLTGCATVGNFFQPATGTCTAPSGGGTVTSFSAGSLAPLFTTSVSTATSTPALAFALSNAAQNSVFAGPASGGAGAPSYQTAPTFSAANLTSFPASLATSGNNTNITALSGLTTPVFETASSENVTFSATPTFSTTVRYSTITMTANITTFTLGTPTTTGLEKTLTFCGPFTVAAPANVRGFMGVANSATGKCSSQHFNYDPAQADWLADGPGVINI